MEKREFRACNKTAWNPHGKSVSGIFMKKFNQTGSCKQGNGCIKNNLFARKWCIYKMIFHGKSGVR